MNLIQEFALLVPVALPVLVIAGLNLWLGASGERDTLLLPGLQRFTSPDRYVCLDETPARTTPSVSTAAANDETSRNAA